MADQISPVSFTQIRSIRFEGGIMFKVSMALLSIILKDTDTDGWMDGWIDISSFSN